MNSIISNNLEQYFGTNSSHSLKFIRNLIRNMNNTRNLSNTVNKKEKNDGFAILIDSFTGLFNNPKELIFNSGKKYFIRYYINKYNESTKQLYGNTYRSPLFPIKINNDNSIELINKNYYVYVLSQDPKNEKLVLQIIIVETTYDDEVILQEKCLGWSLLRLLLLKNENENKNNNNENDREYAPINRGTPRELIFKNNLLRFKEASVIYYPFNYKSLHYIDFLLPNFIILGGGEPLPGLNTRSLPMIPIFNENLKIVDFKIAYVKNINIEINPDLEDNIIQFGNEYRFKKYNTEENEMNKIYIKERKIKCGIHNTWKFINSNGLQNSITLRSITKNKLESNGVLMIDRFYADPLSCIAIIMELEYILTIPIKGNQKEENLSLILGYHIYVPEKLNPGNYSKEKMLMFTGPGMTIYGDKMWYSPNYEDKNIRISYVLSQNDNLAYVSPIQQEIDINNENTIIQKNFNEQNNQTILEQMEINKELVNKIHNLQNQLDLKEDEERKKDFEREKEREREREEIRLLQRKMILEDKDFNNISRQNLKDNSGIKNSPEINVRTYIKKEEITEYQEFIKYKQKKEIINKEINEQEQLLKELKKPKISEFEPTVKNISARDKSTLMSKGVLDLDIKDPGEAYIDLALEKELCEHGLATIFNFQFLSFKPSKTYYKDLRDIPQKIQFFFDFFYEKKHSSVCNIIKPESTNFSNYYHFNNPLILKKENININSTLLNDTKEEVIIEVRYDPSTDNSIDFRDFVKYLLTRRLIVEIKDVQKNLNIGFIKIPLKDLLAQGKDKIQITKEYNIYDNLFKERGIIQLLITTIKYPTIRPYSYQRNNYRNINSKEGYNTLSRKKKVKVGKMDVNKIISENKNLYNYTITNLKNDLNKNNINDINGNNYPNEMNLTHSKELRIEEDLEKKLRVMKYFSSKTNMANTNSNLMNNTNYFLGGNINTNEKRLKELRQKQINNENFLNTLKTCEQIRDFNRKEILSKVSQESHKNSYNISLILGQPTFFNYSIFNDSENEELFHIVIEKIKNNNNQISDIYMNSNKNNIVSVITSPQEWNIIVEKEKMIKPNSFNVISDDLYIRIKPGETIPLIIKLLSFFANKEEEKYSVCIHKKNGEPLYFLNINIKRVFPIYDHIFHYNIPTDNRTQNILLVNPFKNNKTKTERMLNYKYISDNSINFFLDNEKHDFIFTINQENKRAENKFIIFFYSDESFSGLYLTWKIEIEWKEVFEIKSNLGLKTQFLLYINYDSELYKEKTYAGNKITLQLFTDQPKTIIFPQGSDIPFTISPNTQQKTKIILYPKNQEENNLALINCVNVYTRELYQSWLIKYTISYPRIDYTETIDFVIGSEKVFNYNYTNPNEKPLILSFFSGNEEILEVIDRMSSFNSGETKPIKLLIHDKGIIGRDEVLLFISDDSDDFCQTFLLRINFRENNV